MDVPEIDSIAILHPKESIVEILQAVGRAVRPSARGDKIATILVPIFLQAGEHRDGMLISPSRRPHQRVLQALRAHDADIVDVLAVPQVNGTPQGERDRQDGPGRHRRRGRRERGWGGAAGVAADPAVLHPARACRNRPFRGNARRRPAIGLRGLRAAERYRRNHPDLRVPLDGDHHGVKFPLGGWISEQRREHAAGRPNTKQIQKLNELGMVWSLLDRAWEDGPATARQYAHEHATLAAPADAVIEGFPIGKWLETKRTQDRKSGLDAERREALDALVEAEPWNPPHWPVSSQRRLTYVGELLRTRGTGARLEHIALDAVHRVETIGRWAARQRAAWDTLGREQHERLVELGLTRPGAVADAVVQQAGSAAGGGGMAEPKGPKPTRTREQAFEIALSAAAAYRERVGHLEVP
ncbi:helicase associated domain-containing protein, partial [Streptomyces sp. SID3343]|uniref:Helicase associated domain protein n=1 Tax=Streptomyces sp. SID3343 TaxID=2690260 RepID=UPI0013BF3916|nr:helicase [Streptomyces sp. SID3343]